VQKASDSLYCTLNRGIKGTKQLEELIVENYRYLKHNVQSSDTLVTVDVQQR